MSIASLSNAQWLNINVNTVVASEVTANDIAADNLLVSGGVSFQGDIAFSNMQNPWPTQGNSGQILTSNGQGDLYWSNGGGSGGGSVSQIETNTPNTVTITNPNGPIVTIDVTGTGGGSITQLTTNTPDTVTITNPDGPIVTIDVTGGGSSGVSQLTSTDPNIHLSSATGDVSIAINPQLTIEELYVNPTTTTNILSVSNGGVLLEGDVIVNGYSLPSINGNAGEVLSSNSNGTCTWIPMGGGSGSITQISSANNLISVSNPTGPNVTLTASNDPVLNSLTVNPLGTELLVSGAGIALSGSVTINGYMMPETNGQNGQFLSSNTNGVAAWENLTSTDGNIVINQGTQLSLNPSIGVEAISITNPDDATLLAITSDTCSMMVSSQTTGNESIRLVLNDTVNNTSSVVSDTFIQTPQVNVKLSPTTGYTLPTTMGTPNQVMTIGDGGVCSWTSIGGGGSGIQGITSASSQITVTEANNIATLTYDGIVAVESQTPNITVTNVAQTYQIDMPATVNLQHIVADTVTVDTGSESYQLPTTMPTSGQVLEYNGTDLIWATPASGGSTIVGSSNIGVNTVGNTSTISLNPNVTVTELQINNYKMPSAAGTINQVLNLGPSNEIIWRTFALDDIQGSQNIDVSIAGNLATVSLNPDLNISSLQIGNYNMPGSAGNPNQILAMNALNDAVWVDPPTGSGSVVGSANINVSTVGNTSTVSLNPNVSITELQIGSYKLPTTTGVIGQVLEMGSNNQVGWGSPSAGIVGVEGTPQQIVTTVDESGIATIGLNNYIEISGSGNAISIAPSGIQFNTGVNLSPSGLTIPSGTVNINQYTLPAGLPVTNNIQYLACNSVGTCSWLPLATNYQVSQFQAFWGVVSGNDPFIPFANPNEYITCTMFNTGVYCSIDITSILGVQPTQLSNSIMLQTISPPSWILPQDSGLRLCGQVPVVSTMPSGVLQNIFYCNVTIQYIDVGGYFKLMIYPSRNFNDTSFPVFNPAYIYYIGSIGIEGVSNFIKIDTASFNISYSITGVPPPSSQPPVPPPAPGGP